MDSRLIEYIAKFVFTGLGFSILCLDTTISDKGNSIRSYNGHKLPLSPMLQIDNFFKKNNVSEVVTGCFMFVSFCYG